MSTAAAIKEPNATFDELVERLGNIPLSRIRQYPPPGIATEEDVLYADDHLDRLCELVDGVLVEKPMGYIESRLAILLGQALQNYMDDVDLGVVAGPDGMMKLSEGLVRIPDVSVVLWDNLPGGEIPDAPIPLLAPDLAIEVLRESNTPAEMKRKIGEYFAAGSRLVWLIDPEKRIATIYTSPSEPTTRTESESLSGGELLPDFTLSLAELFKRASRRRRT